MAAGQDFLSLTNLVLRRFNEVELGSVNFATARGFHAQAKDAVNAAIRDIHSSGVEWPFNWTTLDTTLTVNQQRYSYPADARTLDGESYRLIRDDSLGLTKTAPLQLISYEEWLAAHGDEEGAAVTSASRPTRVALARNQSYLMSPAPDKAYTLRFEYYAQPSDLAAATDETNIPLPYRFVIVDGACMHCHIFRTDMEASSALSKLYERGLKDMRKNLINKNEYVRPTITGI